MATARDAEVTIVGGGTIGAAVLYHLAEAGYRDLQLIEAGQLAGATSGQAAGLVGQVRTSADRTKLAMASVELFGRFQRESPWPIDWRRTGSIRIATTEARVAEFERMAGVADSAGLEVEMLDSAGLARQFPILEGAEVLAALWCPTDGYLQPNSLTTAYAQAAREMGATVVTGTKVLDVVVRRGAVAGLETDHGSLSAETVINVAGPWAWEVAQMVGLDLPIVPVRHEYFISEPMPGWHAELPVLRLPDLRLYVRAELSSILCGGWEAEALSLDPRSRPGAVDAWPSPDWEVLSSFADALEPFVPGVTTVGIRETFRGWPTFTPDGRFVVGPVPGLRGFVMAAGCNAHGVSGSAGLAQHLVESLGQSPSPYVRSLSPGRFLDGGWTWADARAGAQARYQDYYTVTAADGSSAALVTQRRLGAVVTESLPPELEARLDEAPSLAGRPRTVEYLTGGLTNTNLKVTTPDGRFVARLSSREGDLLSIDREAEYRNSMAAAETGIAPAVVDYLPGRGLLVVAWVEGRTYEPADVRDRTNLARVAAACRTLHAGPRFVNDFDMFRIQRSYLSLVQSRGFRLPDRYLDFMPQVERIAAALAARPVPTVPCNNDLLAANFIDEGDRLWLIDYEYSGNGDPGFELGNIWSESNLSLEQLEELVTHYHSGPRPQQVARARLLGLMSKYGWTLWASIQDGVSDIDFDFWGWGMEKYDRAIEEFDGPDFDALLDQAAAAE